jgi:hypothetical protein
MAGGTMIGKDLLPGYAFRVNFGKHTNCRAGRGQRRYHCRAKQN